MEYCTFAYKDEESAREDYAKLEERKVTGEIALRRHEGRWYLEIGSEKELPESFLSKLRGERL